VRRGGLIDWKVFEARFGPLYHPHVGRPSIPQYVCGFDYLQLELPIDPSSLVRWRRRIGQDGIEVLLQGTIAAARRSEAIKEPSLERVSVDTTVQPKAIAPPLDSRLYHRGREILVRLAQRHGVPLR
jgi:IS5 family transposase